MAVSAFGDPHRLFQNALLGNRSIMVRSLRPSLEFIL